VITFSSIVKAFQDKYGVSRDKAVESVHHRLEMVAGHKISFEDRELWMEKLAKRAEEAVNKKEDKK
jgi:hypothetical protein